jgi:hypothetical protein
MLACCAALHGGPVLAAPLDELLTALPERSAPRATLSVAHDQLNGSLRYFRKQDDTPEGVTPTTGGYKGAHLEAGLRVIDGLWLTGNLWQRTISNNADQFRYRSWRLSAQGRFNEAAGAMPAVALRLSHWGNDARATRSTTPVRVQGAILDTVTITQPSDRQTQVDLIGTWVLSPALDISASVGAGRSQLGYQGLSATTTRNGCRYELEFSGNDIFGTLIPPCSGLGVVRQFFDSSGEYGIDVANEIAWSGRFVQVGVHADWRTGPWTLGVGELLDSVGRKAVDDILRTRGEASYRRNQTITLEADYRVSEHLSVFARSQNHSKLFLSDVPVTYNTSTADSFNNRWSLLSLGLRARF